MVFDNNKDKKYNYSQLAKICIHKLSLRGVLRYFGEDVNKLDPTYKKNAHGELQILEVDYWTQTPILAVIGTFTVTLSTYILIETQEKEVPRTSLEKYVWLSTCYV